MTAGDKFEWPFKSLDSTEAASKLGESEVVRLNF